MRPEKDNKTALAGRGSREYTRLMPTESTMMIVECIRSIPPGQVASYGAIAEMSGSPAGAAGARQVARILHSMSRSYNLPWWRIIRQDGSIALGNEDGRDLQSQLLASEGVEFVAPGRIDMNRYSIR
jgi:methylated-DNA-protein-cysteine methyltransferase-like protein